MTLVDAPARAVTEPARPEPTIGPHAIVHITRVVQEWFGDETANALLSESTPFSLHRLPQSWIPERHAKALAVAVHRAVGPRWAATVLRDAGRRSGQSVATSRPTSIAETLAQRASLITGPDRLEWRPSIASAPPQLTVRTGGPQCARDAGSLIGFFCAAVEQLLRVQLPAPGLCLVEISDTDCARLNYRYRVTGLPAEST
jgi:hypothetical protein